MCTSSSNFKRANPLGSTPTCSAVVRTVDKVVVRAKCPSTPPIHINASLTSLYNNICLFDKVIDTLCNHRGDREKTRISVTVFSTALDFLRRNLVTCVTAKGSPRHLKGHRPCVTPFSIFGARSGPVAVYYNGSGLFSTLYRTLRLARLIGSPQFDDGVLHMRGRTVLGRCVRQALGARTTRI